MEYVESVRFNRCGDKTMSPTNLEQRVERLERILDEMRNETRREPARDDWQATIGAFSADPLAKEIVDEALRLRESERQLPIS
jgi:hypothetical protein